MDGRGAETGEVSSKIAVSPREDAGGAPDGPRSGGQDADVGGAADRLPASAADGAGAEEEKEEAEEDGSVDQTSSKRSGRRGRFAKMFMGSSDVAGALRGRMQHVSAMGQRINLLGKKTAENVLGISLEAESRPFEFAVVLKQEGVLSVVTEALDAEAVTWQFEEHDDEDNEHWRLLLVTTTTGRLLQARTYLARERWINAGAVGVFVPPATEVSSTGQVLLTPARRLEYLGHILLSDCGLRTTLRDHVAKVAPLHDPVANEYLLSTAHLRRCRERPLLLPQDEVDDMRDHFGDEGGRAGAGGRAQRADPRRAQSGGTSRTPTTTRSGSCGRPSWAS